VFYCARCFLCFLLLLRQPLHVWWSRDNMSYSALEFMCVFCSCLIFIISVSGHNGLPQRGLAESP
jgi:hypothetical protein